MSDNSAFHEVPIRTANGWPVAIALLLGSPAFVAALFWLGSLETAEQYPQEVVSFVWLAIAFGVGLVVVVAIVAGFYSNAPLTVSVVSLAGKYVGIDREQGLRWYAPWYATSRVSKRLSNTSIASIRVNDMSGNPIDIGAVVVWRIEDAAKSSYLVENHEAFLRNQTEVSLRVLASRAYYDVTEVEVVKEDPDKTDPAPAAKADTLIENREEAGKKAALILTELIGDIGVEIVSLDITHLSYAPEIASVMLRRQAAAAVVGARRKIVEGAIGIVRHAMESLPELKQDSDRTGAIAANLLTVIIGEQGVTPVINVGDVRG